LPNGESPKKVSVLTVPVLRSRTLTVMTSRTRLITMLLLAEIETVKDPNLLAFVIDVIHACP